MPISLFSFFSETSAPTSTRYKFAGQMRGDSDSVHTLAMSQDGAFLASGGTLIFTSSCYGLTY